MYRFNLNNVSNHSIEIVENFLNKKSTSWESIEHFADVSLSEDFDNSNNQYLLDDVELSILHFDIFKQNKKILARLSTDLDTQIKEILLISIKEEKIKRFKRKLENNLNISDKRLNKDIDLIDKKIKLWYNYITKEIKQRWHKNK